MKRVFAITIAVVAAFVSPLGMKASADPATASEQQIAPDRFVVHVRGGVDAMPDQLREQALLRAAQLTQERGGEWFEIVRRSSSPRPAAVASYSDFGLNYSVTKTCTPAGCLTRATPVVVDAGQTPILDQSIEIMIGSGDALDGGRTRPYVASDVIAKSAAKTS
jgi:hypothetical protein